MIRNPDDLSQAVLAVMQQTPEPRLREIMVSLVSHLHGFVKEVKLTEDEFRAATALAARMGQLSNDSHNEVVLMAGSLGVSSLVCLLNHSAESTHNLLGPFWRLNSPRTENGGSIVRSPTAGVPLRVQARVVHALVVKPGFKTLISQVYAHDDPNLATDVQFGVTETLTGQFVRHETSPADRPDVVAPWHNLEFVFKMEAGESSLPRAPIK